MAHGVRELREDLVELGGEDQFAYVGFCAPDIDKRGTTWVGWLGQAQAWVYREDGLFKDGTGKVAPLKGAAYGSRFGRNANVTGILHSATHVEFLVNGTSQGNVTATVPLPADAVPCVSGCRGTQFRLAGAPPPVPPDMQIFAGPCCRRKNRNSAGKQVL